MTKATADEDGRASNVVVRTMMKDYIGESRTLVTDNVLDNLDLAHYLLRYEMHLVGTLRQNLRCASGCTEEH
jgi:hypothetical protein